MELQRLHQPFSICKLRNLSGVRPEKPFYFLSVTDDEISLVCPTETVPADTVAREDGWRGFRVRGALDFSLVGVIAQISALLAKEEISIFAVSTFDTDYVFTKESVFDRAVAVLKKAGYPFL
jgi:uncharacterized protein